MRKNLSLFVAGLLIGIIAVTDINAQIRTPQPSPAGTVSSVVGLTNVEISYFRPGVKGRQIFGEGAGFLIPFGQIWRTGANSGSVLSLSTDVKIAGQDVEAGEYLIITIPGEDKWQFMLYSDLSMGGNVASYDESMEVLRVTANTMEAPMTERLTFNIADISADNTSANIELQWETTVVKVPMEVDFDEQVMADIAEKTRVNPSNYVQAANYYLSTNRDLDKALEWVNMYLAEGDNSKQFWNVHLKARILAAMGKNKEAIKTAEASMEAASNNPNGDFGYIKRNEDLIKEIKGK